MNDPREPNNDEIQEPNTGITSENEVEAFQERGSDATQEPNTGVTREPEND